MGYNTVFEIGFRSFPWNVLFHPVPFILIGLLLFRFGKGKQIYLATGIILAAVAAIFVLIGAISLVPKFVEIRHSYKTGNSSSVEGIVENFHAAPALGAAEESFSVRGVKFSYNTLEPTPCFHNGPFRKGPIRAALDVRIFYQDGCIQRVDIRK
jgi:hypothetical protein